MAAMTSMPLPVLMTGKHQHNRYSAMKISKPEKRQRRQWLYGISSKELLHHNILKSIETPTNAFEEKTVYNNNRFPPSPHCGNVTKTRQVMNIKICENIDHDFFHNHNDYNDHDYDYFDDPLYILIDDYAIIRQ